MVYYKVVDMPMDVFTKEFHRHLAEGTDFDFQDKILAEEENPYALTDYDDNLTVLVYNDGDREWFSVEEIINDKPIYRDFLAIPFN